MTNSHSTPRKQAQRVLASSGAIVLLVVLGLFVMKSFQTDHSSSTIDFVPEVGAIAPPFDLHTLDGKRQAIDDIPQKIRLINFWATWCESCLVEMPSILTLLESFKNQGFGVFFVSVDESPEDVVPQLLLEMGFDFTPFIDLDQKLSQIFRTEAIPLTVVLDQNRKILFYAPGERDWSSDESKEKVSQWLKM